MSNTGDTITAGGGFINLYGPNGKRNVSLWHLDSFDNNGLVEVHDANGVVRAGIKVDSSGTGIVFGDVKSFRMDNPLEPGTELWYSSLEGPEAAAYVRGTEELVNGTAVVYFPEHFVTVASPEGMTVQIVPLSADSRGLAVVEKHADHIVVQELQNGTGNYSFDFTVTAVRKGFEDYKVVRKIQESVRVQKSSNKTEPTNSEYRKVRSK